MNLGAPYFLPMLAIVPAAILFLLWAARERRRRLVEFCEEKLLARLTPGFSPGRRKAKEAILVTALGFMTLALSRPQWGFRWELVKKHGIEVVMVLDTSKSMLAQDVQPSRLDRAKLELRELVREFDQDKAGLVVFAGKAFPQCPMTLDYRTMDLQIDHVTTDVIPVKGTAIGEAIGVALGMFLSNDPHSKAIILLTDGEETANSNPLKIAEQAKALGVKIFPIGFGSGKPAPMPAEEGSADLKKDAEGNLIMSTLDEDTLKKIAETTGGTYVRSETGELNFRQILTQVREKTVPKDLQGTKARRWEDRYQVILFLALVLLGVESFLREVREEGSKGGVGDGIKGKLRRLFSDRGAR